MFTGYITNCEEPGYDYDSEIVFCNKCSSGYVIDEDKLSCDE